MSYDLCILDENVPEVRAYVATLTDRAELDALHDAERTSGRGQEGTGRRGVLDAIEERRGELGLTDPNPGLARGQRPEATEAEPRPPAPAPPGWTKVRWRGHDLYRCAGKDRGGHPCRFESFDVGEVYAHVKQKHPGL
jgi:hypothetical protein